MVRFTRIFTIPLALMTAFAVVQCSHQDDISYEEKQWDEEVSKDFGWEIVTPEETYHIKNVASVSTNYAKVFNDKQATQIKAARKYGVTPTDSAGIIADYEAGRLVKIKESNLYYLHDVSYPYLTPKAADLLAEIGTLYQEYVGIHERLRVTSCMRTDAHVKQMKKRNVNAVTNSCHLYGTTFDISYALMDDAEVKALARALKELQNAGYCYVKYEIQQPCFHITARQ